MLKKINTLLAFLFLTCAIKTQAAHQRIGVVKSLHNDTHSPVKDIIKEQTCCGLNYENAKRLTRLSCPVGSLMTAMCITHYFAESPALNGGSAWQLLRIPFELYTPASNSLEKEFICARSLACICTHCPHCATLTGGLGTYACTDCCVDQCFDRPNVAKMED